MMRNLRVLGIALTAMLAMSALAASAAHAATSFVAGNGTGTAKFTVVQSPSAPLQVLKTSVGTVECAKFHAEGTGSAQTTEVKLENLEYSECELGGLAAVVENHSCRYDLRANGEVDLELAGCEIKIKAISCTVTVAGPQDGLESMTYTNIQEAGKKKEVTANAKLGSIHYSYSGGCGSGSKTNGIYEGALRARATDASNNPIDLKVESVASEAKFYSAAGATFKIEQDPSTPLQVLTMTPFNLECESLHAEGTGSATTGAIELPGPAYLECPNIYGLQDKVKFNTCRYNIRASGALELTPAGCQVQIESFQCLVKINGGVSFPSAITYTNVHESGKPREVIAHMEFSSIQYSWEGLYCAGGVKGSKENGTYKGTVRVKAFNSSGTQVNLRVE